MNSVVPYTFASIITRTLSLPGHLLSPGQWLPNGSVHLFLWPSHFFCYQSWWSRIHRANQSNSLASHRLLSLLMIFPCWYAWIPATPTAVLRDLWFHIAATLPSPSMIQSLRTLLQTNAWNLLLTVPHGETEMKFTVLFILYRLLSPVLKLFLGY